MGKHSIESDKDFESNERIKRIVYLENEIKRLENDLIQERADRIEDLNNIYSLANCNHYNNEKMFLHKIAETISDRLLEISNGIIQKQKTKESSSNTDQSI